MLKVIGRLLVILMVTGLFTAGVYLLIENSPGLFGSSGRGIGEINEGFPSESQGLGENFAPRGDRPSGAFEQGLEGREIRGGHDREGGFSVFGLLGIAKNLGVIALVTLGVWALAKLARLVKRRRTHIPQSGGASIGQEV